VTPTLIDKPGVYDLPAEVYHADPVKGGSLSSTGARQLLTCPARYEHQRRHGRPDKKEFDLGRAAHARVLGAGDDVEVIVGTGKNPNAWATDADKAAVARARAAGRTPIKPVDAETIEEMAAALRAHPDAGPLFAREGQPEQVLIYQDEETGVWCRVMADWIPTVAPTGRVLVVDYKSTTNADPAAFARIVAAYGYHDQGAFYTDAVTALGLDNGNDPAFVIVAQEKEPPYLVSVHPLDSEALAWGRIRMRKARDIYQRCTDTGHWPGYRSDRLAPLALPSYVVHQYEAAEQAGQYDIEGDRL
jgi:PDDEXK-like domain of unknown function (DUF3799)